MRLLRVLGVVRMAMVAFGGEKDPVVGPWHHEMITEEAAQKATGWDEAVGNELAWHADYVDSYLYNPAWWALGGVGRLKASLAGNSALKKLHFDDLFTTEQIVAMWRRYLGGTVAGLIWTWRSNDVGAARNIVGASLHALQDFYSHSNWVDDPDRRTRTWLQTAAADRARAPLYTGSYEQPDHLGIKPHGKPAPLCAVLKRMPEVMNIMCHAVSPLAGGALCEQWRACQGAQAVRPEEVLGIPVPPDVYYLAPPGIALDSTWQAEIGVQVRGVTDIGGAALFGHARDLALQTSVAWLRHLEQLMAGMGGGDFWTQVRTQVPVDGAREREFENFSRFPYMFLTAGPYPPPPRERGDEWYLRVRLRTAAESGAGTDADIVAHAAGRQHVLDYMPQAHPLLAYNDFEAGDDEVHYLGPYPVLPDALELENRAARVSDVFAAIGRAFVTAVQSAIDALGDFLLSLIGGHADVVGGSTQVWSPAQLRAVPAGGGQLFQVRIRGGTEGEFVVHGTVRRVGRVQEGARFSADYQVTLDRLECIEESDWDRFSDSDEPVLMAVLVNQAPGAIQKYLSAPFDDVDSGESRDIGHIFAPARVPDDYGYLSLAVQILESDDEGAGARQQAIDTFAQRVDIDAAPPRRDFVSTLGAAVASDWKLGRLEVFAFTRGETVLTGDLFAGDVNRWIRGNERAAFPLRLANARSVAIGLDASVGAIDLTARSPAARWAGAVLTDASGNMRDSDALPFNGNDGDARGFVRLGAIPLEDGTIRIALWTHPKWVAHGTIKGWHPDEVLPQGAAFEAEVGFKQGAFGTDGVRFLVFEHHTEQSGRRVWNAVVDVTKAYTGALQSVRVDLSYLAGQAVGIELRVDAGPSPGQDWAVWVHPRIVPT